MYLALVLIVLAVLFALWGIISGGVFTAILIPLAAVAIVAAAVTVVSARAAGIRGTLFRPPPRQSSRPVAPGAGAPPGEEQATPEEFTQARQRTQ